MKCRICNADNPKFLCGGCLKVPLCSAKCQEIDWNRKIGVKCHNEQDVITLEDIPPDHFDLKVGDKNYCFDYLALSEWINKGLTSRENDTMTNTPNTVRYLIDNYDIEHFYWPNNPITGAKFTKRELKSFADAYEAFLFRHPEHRVPFNSKLIIRIYDAVGSADNEWNILSNDPQKRFWSRQENDLSGTITKDDIIQYDSLSTILAIMSQMRIVTNDFNIIEPRNVSISLDIDDSENDEPIYHEAYLFDYEILYTVLDTGLDKHDLSVEEFEQKMRNGEFETAILTIGYHMDQEESSSSD
jgi:hypothetical protein